MTAKLYQNYFDNPTFSDLTIRLSDRTVSVHRVILCRKSEYFSSLLAGHFKVCSGTETGLYCIG
jgi:hypothetical protein